MQKLRELNKGKYIYNDLYECVDYFLNFDFMKPAMEHIGPYRAIQNNNDPYWSTWDHSGPYQTMVFAIEHKRPCRTVLDNTEPYGTKQI